MAEYASKKGDGNRWPGIATAVATSRISTRVKAYKAALGKAAKLNLKVVRGPAYGIHTSPMLFTWISSKAVSAPAGAVKKNGAKVFAGCKVFTTWSTIRAALIEVSFPGVGLLCCAIALEAALEGRPG